MGKKRIIPLLVAFITVAGFNGVGFAGNLEPQAAPGPTMKTLDDIPPTWSQILPVLNDL